MGSELDQVVNVSEVHTEGSSLAPDPIDNVGSLIINILVEMEC